ncbi:MAG: primosomal protein N' [Bacillota bacterium]|nr:primosomal protein N' [Bacillota bacterium]
MDSPAFAKVIVDLPLIRVDRVYDYRIPEPLRGRVRPGVKVLVPFGRRQLAGYVIGVAASAAVVPVKDILDVLDEQPAFTAELYDLACWVARRYLCTVSEALRAVAAPGRNAAPLFRDEVYPNPSEDVDLGDLRRQSPKQARVLELAASHPGLTRAELAARAEVSPGVVNRLMQKGLLSITRRVVERDPYLTPEPCDPPRLTGAQEAALEPIAGALRRCRKEVFLLHGVTGSGKTEVYLRAVGECLDQGRQALVLVPEISLTGQMVERFKGRFGRRVAVMHSRLGTGERHDEWRRAFRGEAPVVLGARSAILAPLTGLGLIVIDEEHEPSYKQDEDPKYHARDVALRRAQTHGAVVVLGSATPSLRAYAQAVKGENCRLLKLPRRIDDRPMPSVSVVDLREEYRSGNRTVFSRFLVDKIRERLARREQVILFLNRRGYATVILCRECGHAFKCPHCAITLTYHRDGFLRCHYCGYQVRLPGRCPACAGEFLGHFGTGTQRVEENARRLFPEARVLRMDSDTMTRKQAHERLIKAFRDREADILVGTQMVAKGLDLPGVTLVGVVNADTSLLLPDYRAAERTFQLLAQVAGRAGRGGEPGEVVLQTYSPDHYSIRAAAQHAYERFFIEEMGLRRQLGYPPFTCLARVLFSSRDEGEARAAAERFAGLVRDPALTAMGPSAAPLARIKDQYRWHLVCKAAGRMDLARVLQEAAETFANSYRRRVHVSIDLDPQMIL